MILFNMSRKCQAMQNTYRFQVYMADTVQVVLQIHFCNTAAMDENSQHMVQFFPTPDSTMNSDTHTNFWGHRWERVPWPLPLSSNALCCQLALEYSAYFAFGRFRKFGTEWSWSVVHYNVYKKICRSEFVWWSLLPVGERLAFSNKITWDFLSASFWFNLVMRRV